MILLALLSLAFSLWMGWTLYVSVGEEKLSGFRDWMSVLWIGAGSAAGIIVAVFSIGGVLS